MTFVLNEKRRSFFCPQIICVNVKGEMKEREKRKKKRKEKKRREKERRAEVKKRGENKEREEGEAGRLRKRNNIPVLM